MARYVGCQRDAGTGISGKGVRRLLQETLSNETQSVTSLEAECSPDLRDFFGKQARHPALGQGRWEGEPQRRARAL